jgi:hypothetical protein
MPHEHHAIASRVPIPWRSSADAFTQILRRRGVEPDAVRDVEVAWDAFGEFLQIEVEGVEGFEKDDDGFVVQWGRWDWNDNRPALSFVRQLAVVVADERDDSGGQPEHWQVELLLVFGEDPAWEHLDSLGHPDTGIDFGEIGAPRNAAFGRTRHLIESLPELAAVWRAQPLRSDLTFERAG